MRPRVLAGFVLAPAVVPLAVVVFALARDVRIPESLVLGSIYAAFTYGAAIALGIPAYLVFSRKGWMRLWQYAAAGAGIGAALLLGISLVMRKALFEAPAVLIFIGVGVLSATIFWLVAVCRCGSKGRPGHGLDT